MTLLAPCSSRRHKFTPQKPDIGTVPDRRSFCMKVFSSFVLLVIFQLATCFVPTKRHHGKAVTAPSTFKHLRSTLPLMADTKKSESIDAKESKKEEIAVPTYLPSEMGIDYVPLATMLATGDYFAADQFTRDNLIKIGGPGPVSRGFVYWTEVDSLPETDLCTMERLWLLFSEGKFGYSIQKRIWDVENANFDNFIRRIGWTKIDNGVERKLKWFGQSEFIYDVDKAVQGHLPLTSALRGTQLLRKLMEHKVWEKYDWKNYKDLKWEP